MAQARHTPATFSDPPPFHPAADSTWETVKAQARRTPATNSVASMVHPPQTAAWKAKKTKSGPARDTSAKVIIQDGWSVPVVHSFEEFRLADTGICLATRSEAEEAMRELRSGGGLAILTTADRSWVGRDRIRKSKHLRACQQCGSVTWCSWKTFSVTYKCSSPRGGAEEADTSFVVIGFHKKYCHPDAWKTATTRPKSATAYWLKKLGAEPVDSGGTDGVEVLARVQKDNFEKVLRGSGEFGVFSRPFFVKGDARVYKDVPLPVELDLQAAMRKAKAVGPSILGVVLRRTGLGLCSKECDFESVVGQVYSEEESKRFIGERWEATDLPLSWSKAAVQAFLADWPCTVEASFREGKTRSAIIRSAVPPHRRLQHDFGCSHIRPAGNHANVKMRRSLCGQNQENHSGKSKGCEILGECGPRKPHATSDSETSARWKRVDGHDSSRYHHSHPGSGQQPGSHAGLALAKVATVGHPATSAISNAGRRGRTATGTHGVGAVDCDNCRTARVPAAFPPNGSHDSEKRQQQERRVRRTRRFLLRIWRKRRSRPRQNSTLPVWKEEQF